MDKKYQIFVSSTYEDLKNERDLVIKAILEMGHIPVGMEMFSAADEQQWNLIKRQIDQSDYYVVILAHRYGSMDGGVSYTEKEYDYACEQGVPTLGFVIDDKAKWSSEFVDKDPQKITKLESFKEKVKGKLISCWKNADDLYGKSSISLMKAMTTYPRIGWVRGDIINGPEVTKEITRLSAENSKLRNEVTTYKLKDKTEEENKEKELVDILKKNKRTVYVWLTDAKGWGKGYSSNLLNIFEYMARELLNEATTEKLAASIAFEVSNKVDYSSDDPIPSNHLREYLSDFVSLGLIKASKKKHSVKDKHEYWVLTDLGRKLHSDLRRIMLKEGTVEGGSPES